MKFAVALTLASTAMAGVAVRDIKDVTAVMETVGKDIDAVKSAADSYNGDKTELVKAAEQLISDLKSGKTKVDAGSDIPLEDALALRDSVNDLADRGAKLTDALKSKKSEVEKAGECKTVQDDISAINTNSNALIDSVVSKVPKAAEPVARDIAAPLVKVLKEAVSAYEDCKDSGNGGSSSTGTGSETSTPTGTGSETSTPTGTGSVTTTATHPIGTVTTDCPPGSTGGHSTGGVKPTSTQVTVPTGAAALYAPAGLFAAAAAALAL